MVSLKSMFKNKLITTPLIISAVIFIVSVLVGLYLYDGLIPLVGDEVTIDNIEIGTIDILKNNLLVILSNIFFSIVTFGIYGVISNSFNGIILGVTMGLAYNKFGLKTVLLRILPHGIVEIPTIIVSTAFGFIVVSVIINLIKKKSININKLLAEIVILIVSTLLLVVVAALIEGNISMFLS